MKCPKCASNLDFDALYCSGCGTKVNSPITKEIIVTVGRANDNDIIIRNSLISSHHARFKISADKIILEDLNSANGLFINSRKYIISSVAESDIIQFSRQYQFNWKELEKFIPKSFNSCSGANDTPLSRQYKSNPLPPKPQIVFGNSIQNKTTITIGRTNENDIVINNIKVSRKHAKFEKSGETWFIEDLGSSNKTFVNGHPVKRTPVSATDAISIGGIPLNFKRLFQTREEMQGDVILTAKNLGFSVSGRIIIDDISLTFAQGEFVGLIGPSGAGKTSLMLMLNGVIKPSAGNVFINSESLLANYSSFKGLIGYVPQDDIIHRELKVEESLKFTAKLRFNPDDSDNEIQTQVDKIIDTLDLVEARNTLIGTAEKKGISGGQRKRVNLGQELLTEPTILFLDEPTSGLDPKTDMDVMNLLKNIADKGNIVILTTHNITTENFDILTHLVVLTKGGKLAYFGPSEEATAYFNVSKPYQIFDSLNSQEPDYWKEKFHSSDYYSKYVTERRNLNGNTSNGIVKDQNRERKADLKQFFTLTHRNLKIKLRDIVSTSILLFQAPIIAVLIAIVFSKPEDKTQALFVLVIAAIWLGCSNAAREIVSEQSIYKRERMVNLKIPSYLFSKVFVLSLLCLLQAIILAGITVPALNLEINFFRLAALLLVTSISSLSIGLFISSFVSTNEAAMGLIPLALIPQVILGGLISKFADMNSFIKALSGLMISRWAFEASLIGEFTMSHRNNSANSAVIKAIGFNESNIILDFSVIFIFNITFLIFTILSLKRKDTK